jgi:peptide/nickel transport system ATP-binding protein
MLRSPKHPYTRRHFTSLPRPGSRAAHGQQILQEITGFVPVISAFPSWCRFHPRCNTMTDVCRASDPAPTPLGDTALVRCHHPA